MDGMVCKWKRRGGHPAQCISLHLALLSLVGFGGVWLYNVYNQLIMRGVPIGTAVSMDTVGGVLLSEIDQSISTFGTGWNTALCIKAFYQADPNSDDIGSTWETLIKQ